MHNRHQSKMNSSWYASDLDYFKSGSEFRILSVHKNVINLVSDKYSRLLIIAVEGPVKGPSTVGLAEKDFLCLDSLISETDCFRLEKDRLNISGNSGTISVNIYFGEKISFNVADYAKTEPAISGESYLFYNAILKRWPSPSASAVLLDLTGGEDYFRNELLVNYPHLVQSILKPDEEEFLNRCRKIIGTGRGLTPTGDDLIHGTLVTFRYFRPSIEFENRTFEEMLNLCNNTTLHGRHMIDLALHGLTLQPVIELLKVIATVHQPGYNLNRLLDVGSSTGYDLAVAVLYSASQIGT